MAMLREAHRLNGNIGLSTAAHGIDSCVTCPGTARLVLVLFPLLPKMLETLCRLTLCPHRQYYIIIDCCEGHLCWTSIGLISPRCQKQPIYPSALGNK